MGGEGGTEGLKLNIGALHQSDLGPGVQIGRSEFDISPIRGLPLPPPSPPPHCLGAARENPPKLERHEKEAENTIIN